MAAGVPARVSSHFFAPSLPLATPAHLPAWFEPYTQWRMLRARKIKVPAGKYLRPRVPRNITRKELGWVLDEWDRYLLWEAWIDSGHKPPRPAGLWLNASGKPVSPGWAGDTLKLVHHYREGPAPPPPPTPPPPVDYDVTLGYSWVVMAENPNKAVNYPAHMGIMFTADHAYERPSGATLATLRSRGQRVRSWCDCHSTFPDEAKKMARDLGLDGWCGEGESSGAFQTAVDAGAELVLINLSALTPDQKERYVRPRKTVCINELYLNQDASRADRENWENFPIAGRLVACYNAAGEADTGKVFPMTEYFRINKYAPHHDSFYDPGATDADRGLVQ